MSVLETDEDSSTWKLLNVHQLLGKLDPGLVNLLEEGGLQLCSPLSTALLVLGCVCRMKALIQQLACSPISAVVSTWYSLSLEAVTNRYCPLIPDGALKKSPGWMFLAAPFHSSIFHVCSCKLIPPPVSLISGFFSYKVQSTKGSLARAMAAPKPPGPPPMMAALRRPAPLAWFLTAMVWGGIVVVAGAWIQLDVRAKSYRSGTRANKGLEGIVILL